MSRSGSRPARVASTSLLQPGDKAPSFALLDQRGDKVKLADHKGHKVLVFFYPETLT
jgi:peroxiredoxin Q/BCP